MQTTRETTTSGKPNFYIIHKFKMTWYQYQVFGGVATGVVNAQEAAIPIAISTG